QDKVATSAPANSKEEIDALRSEVHSLKEEMQTAAEGEQTLKAEDITGNVYSEFAKKVKLGGQIRTRAEYSNGYYNVPTGNATLPGQDFKTRHASQSTDDDYVLNQARLWADADVNEHLRVFIQLQDARVFGSEGTTVGYANPGNENSIFDLHQGYFDIKKLFELPLTVRVGRQEIVWGDHRVIGNFVWSNVGRVFDGGRIMWDTDATHAEVFAARVDEKGFLGDTSTPGDKNANENLYAAQYAFKKLVPSALLELMYIQKNDQDSVSNSAVTNGFAAPGAGTVVIHDIGARIDGKVPDMDAWDYTVEAHGQFGDYADLTQRAYAGAARTGYTFKDLNWKPRFGVEYDYASGDHNPTDGKHTTFDNLYPTNHWQGNYGFVDLLSWQNLHDARANVKVQPTNKLTAQVDYHYYWLASANDGWYLANGTSAFGHPGVSSSNSLADEIDLTVGYDLYKNVKILAGYSFFDPNAWITQTAGDHINTQWGYLQTTVTF
ncbi:MAG TPA: alginate export family protein, partial [Candidatus Brocadiaceae bacterium]